MNIIFLGTPDFAVPFLQSLIGSDHAPVAVVSQPDRPSGRKQEVLPTPVKALALAHGIPVFQPDDINTPEAVKHIAALKPDLIVTVAFGQIISQAVLDIPSYGCINVHPSLLPKYRGAIPLQEAIMHGDSETGVSIIMMDAKMDHGPILAQEKISMDPSETTATLREKTTVLGTKLLIQVIGHIAANTASSREQDHTQATFTRLMTRDTGKIDWSRSSHQIDCQIRALNPWPGTWTEWQGKRIKILQAQPLQALADDQEIGAFFEHSNSLIIQCGTGQLDIEKLQIEGKGPISGSDFVKGYLS